jgi:hypothetical protein
MFRTRQLRTTTISFVRGKLRVLLSEIWSYHSGADDSQLSDTFRCVDWQIFTDVSEVSCLHLRFLSATLDGMPTLLFLYAVIFYTHMLPLKVIQAGWGLVRHLITVRDRSVSHRGVLLSPIVAGFLRTTRKKLLIGFNLLLLTTMGLAELATTRSADCFTQNLTDSKKCSATRFC